MAMKSSVSSKGQVTIPKRIRERLGLKAGTTIEFELRGATFVARKGRSRKDPVDAVTGIIALGKSVDEYIEDAREPVK